MRVGGRERGERDGERMERGPDGRYGIGREERHEKGKDELD